MDDDPTALGSSSSQETAQQLLVSEVLARMTAAALTVSSAEPGRVFEDLARGLTGVLGTEAALIAVFVDGSKQRMRTLALVHRGRLLRRVEYDVSLTPCRHIVGRASRFVPHGVNREFSPGTIFAAQGFDAYAGYSILNDAGEQLGIIAALDRKPLANQELTEALLKIFAVRAAAELERQRVEAALAASETSYRAIFEASEDAIFVHDWASGAILDISPKASELYGYSSEELRQMRVGEFSANVPPYTEADAIAHIERAKASATAHRFEWHARHRDGHLMWHEVTLKRVEIAGQPRVLAFVRDITEARQAAEALRASEEQYRAIFNASVDAAILWNSKCQRVDVNPAYTRIYGWAREDVIGRGQGAPRFSEEYEKPRLELVRRALAGESCRAELETVRKDGVRLLTEVQATPFRHLGEPHALFLSRDITEHKRAEEALRASEQQYRAIFNASADALVLRDAEFRIVDVNATYERMSGWTRAEVVGLDQVVANPSDVAATIRALHARALAGEAISLEVPLVRRDGTRYEIELRGVPIQHRGQPHVLYMGRDITEQKRAEEALRTSEEQYRAIFNASADALVLWDSQYRRVDVNLAYQQMYGWAREEVIGRSYEMPQFSPEYAQPRLDLVRRALAGESCHAELLAIRRDGTTVLTEVHAIPFRHLGQPHVLAIARDITERKQAEHALRASEEQYRSIFEAATDSLQLLDAEHRVVDVNPAYERMYGRHRDEVIGKTLDELVPEQLRSERRALVARALAGEAAEMQTVGYRRDGTAFDLEVRVIPFQHRGQPHVLGIARDITERRRAELALRASEEQYRAIFNASADAMLLRDDSMMIVDANPAFLALCGLPREQVVGRKHAPFVTEAYEADAARVLGEAMAGSRGTMQAQTRSFDGAVLDVEVRAIPMLYRGRRHVLAIARNTTAEKRAEAERHRFEARLRQAQKMEAIGQLTGGIAHDFNNILASVMGYVVLAEERAGDAGDTRSVEYLGQALGSCRRARDLIQQMLTFSRGGRGEPRALSLAALVSDAMPMLRSALPSTLAIVVDVDKAVPAVWVDEVQAHQVLLNLAINARDAMERGGTIRIAVRRAELQD
ncbi:MAG: PAS domain S-box protein, partial [Betaproteobacteria bacterium]